MLWQCEARREGVRVAGLRLDDFFDKFEVFNATRTAEKYVPATAGVYAYYPMLEFKPDDLLQQLDAHVQRHRFDPTMKHERRNHKMVIDLRGSARSLHGEAAQMLSDADESFRRDFCTAILACSLFQNPWYVGKADSLRVRFGYHLTEADGAVVRWRRAHGNEPLLYVAYRTPTEQARTLESFLLQIVDTDGNTQRS